MNFAWTSAPPVRAVMDALGARGEARFVGGCVRDSLLGMVPATIDAASAGTTDIDVATTLTPNDTIAALKDAGLAAHPTGVAHGTVTAVADDLPVEVTTLRADVATDGRHAEVRFTTDWNEDWRRRDFTINAMYLCVDGTLFDPADGQVDLNARRVRFIGDADQRIAEDYLRILRFFRFTSRYGDAADAEGLAACERGAAGIDCLSKERIWQEFVKLVATPNAPAMLRCAHQTGVVARVVALPPTLDAFAALHRLLKGGVASALALEALWPSAAQDIFKTAFKPPNDVLVRISALRAAHARLTSDNGTALSRALYRYGERAVRDAAIMRAARADDPAPWLDLHLRAGQVAVPVLPVQGRDLIARGVTPGPGLGQALLTIEAAWLSAGCPADKVTVDRIIRQTIDAR